MRGVSHFEAKGELLRLFSAKPEEESVWTHKVFLSFDAINQPEETVTTRELLKVAHKLVKRPKLVNDHSPKKEGGGVRKELNKNE